MCVVLVMVKNLWLGWNFYGFFLVEIFAVDVALVGAKTARFSDLLRSANSLSGELYTW